jgi:hypothetical protein
MRKTSAEYSRIRRLRQKTNGLCRDCNTPVSSTARCAKCSDYQKQAVKRYRVARRAKVFSHYGGFVCACCGEKEPVFLCIDHINGGGHKHRVTERFTDLVYWLYKNKYPKGYQVLCFNCNMAKHINGECPHQRAHK